MSQPTQSPAINEMLESIRSRKSISRWGIGVASSYLAEIERFAGAGQFDADEWRKCVKEAESRFTFCDPAAVVEKAHKKGSAEFDISAIPNAILGIDAIITSKNMDRDGDVLDPMGANVDKNMPLLWQHMPQCPVGRFCGLTKQDGDVLAGRFAILDTSLGRDVAILAEGGALRGSQGFKPIEADVLTKGADGKPASWFVKKYETVEYSMVSVPSNVDSVVTAFHRKQLSDPLMKAWAGELDSQRSKVVNVPIDLKGKAGGDASVQANGEPEGTPAASQAKSAADTNAAASPAIVTKETKELGDYAKKYLGLMSAEHIPGSFEFIQSCLRRDAQTFLPANGVEMDDDEYCMLVATFADSAIVCVGCWRSNREDCYQVSWSMSDAGMPKFNGVPQPVTVTPVVIAKSLESQAVVTKNGKPIGRAIVEITVNKTVKEEATKEASETASPATRSQPSHAAAEVDEIAEFLGL